MNGNSAYFSFDIEADGKIPGRNSMQSIGVAYAGHHDNTGFHPVDDVTAHVFYRELTPISDEFDPEAVAVTGLDRDYLREHGTDPAQAMSELSAWVRDLATAGKPVFVGYPAGYDWLFTYWYLINFGDSSVFGHSRMLDMKSFYAGHSGRPLAGIVKRTMPRELMSTRRHTHRADDDAVEQAEMFINLMNLVQETVGMRVAP